jgi:hypothetical protein
LKFESQSHQREVNEYSGMCITVFPILPPLFPMTLLRTSGQSFPSSVSVSLSLSLSLCLSLIISSEHCSISMATIRIQIIGLSHSPISHLSFSDLCSPPLPHLPISSDTYLHLRSLGYTIDLLRGPYTCFDASLYGILLITDSEEILTEEEINKLENDVRTHSLSLLLIADWYDEITLRESHFFDDNTHSEWYPITGGSNVPEINQLLQRFEIQIGLQSFSGSFGFDWNLPSVGSPSLSCLCLFVS